MHTHSIDYSVLSLANPWLDFLPAQEGANVARKINDEMNGICEAQNQGSGELGERTKWKRLYAFGTLPLSAPVKEVVVEVERLQRMRWIRGVILGTTGLGSGLDDPALNPVWVALTSVASFSPNFLVFIHPHYGLPTSVFGPAERECQSGHVLPLSLGFPMETTIAFVRMYLSGVFERYPELKILLAHAGGCVPFLAGRVESCVLHERTGRKRSLSIWDVLKKNVWLDGVIYSEVGLKAAVQAVGRERVLFGTDHPFFPPLEDDEHEEGERRGEGSQRGEESTLWKSVSMNVDAVQRIFVGDEEGAAMVLGGNAVTLLGLDHGNR